MLCIKHRFTLCLVVIMYLLLHTVETPAATPPAIFVDNVPVFNETVCYENNCFLVPTRMIAEELGARVSWDGEHVIVKNEKVNIEFRANRHEAIVNGEAIKLVVAPRFIDGRLFVPLRFICETLDTSVLYRENKIFLYTPQFTNQIDYNPRQFEYAGDRYVLNTDGKIYKNGEALPIDGQAWALLSVSRSGLVYSDYRVKYYNFDNQESIQLYYNTSFYGTNNGNPLFTDLGNFYYTDISEVKKVSDNRYERYYAIFVADIDGQNIKKVFVEDANYKPIQIMLHKGWLYYKNMAPVEKSYGVDYYSGAIYRVKIDGTGKQQLTDEGVWEYYLTNDGIYYRYKYSNDTEFLSFSEL